MKKTGAQTMLECLVREGVEYIFGYPGGMNLPLYDAMPEYPQLKHILVRHEQAAAHAADAYARVTGKVGVCLATSGPGATNLVTGIANAWMDSIPMVAITGEVVTWLIGRDGFQEADITGITLPITKHNYLLLDAEDMAHTVREAFHIAGTGRPGPVLIDVPRDVFVEQVDFHWPEKLDMGSYRPTIKGHPAQIAKAAELITKAERPLIMTGHGVVMSDGFAELRELAEKAQIPVVSTLLGLSSFPGTHPLYLGMCGMHGLYTANIAIQECDLLVAAGCRFDDRVTGRLKDFAPNAHIVHIDIDPAEIGKNVKTAVPIVGDAKSVLGELVPQVKANKHQAWVDHLHQLQREHPSLAIPESDGIPPQYVIKKVYEMTRGQAYYVTGVGQHQMWAAQHFNGDKPRSFVSSGGLGTMGFDIPAAMGVQFAKPDDTVWTFCGDGSFQMTIQELATIVEHDLPIKFAILNNGWLGMVRQWQTLFYDDRKVGTKMYSPDFIAIAKAYGIEGMKVEDRSQVEWAIDKALTHKGPFVLDFHVEPEENVFPMVPPGASISEMMEAAPAKPKAESKPKAKVRA